MKIYNYSEARQNFSTVLNTALIEDVIITRKDGSKFKLTPIQDSQKKKKSPLEAIEGIKTSATNLTMGDILDAIREGRERCC